MKGTVRRFELKRGFGFITDDWDPKVPYFFHNSNVTGRVSEGDRVTFTAAQSDKGPVAIDVVKIEE